MIGAWLLWSAYSTAAATASFYTRLDRIKGLNEAALPNADYDLHTLPWKVASAAAFDLTSTALRVVTSAKPYDYQAFATIDTKHARTADIVFDSDIQAGGATIGFVQNGKWIVSNSATQSGRFADENTVNLGRDPSLTVVVANDNAAGESRFTIRSLRVYLRR